MRRSAAVVSEYLRLPAVSEVYGLSEGHLRKLVFRKGIPYVKVGKCVLFKRADVKAFFESRRVPAASDIRSNWP